MTNPARGVTQPNNVAGQAGDYVQRVQQVDATGAVVGGGGVASTVTQGTAAAVTSGWPTINGELTPDTTGTFTNATQATSITTAASLDGYGTALVSINGTYGTATAVFEGSDDGGTTWYSISGGRSDSGIIETGYTGLTNLSRAWFVTIAGFDALRVRSSAVASGTVNVRVSVSSAPTSEGTTVATNDAVATLTDGRTTVTTAGTAVALASTATIRWVTVTALVTNTQQVNVGASTVLAASGTQRGVPLLPGDSVTIPVSDISKVFVDSRVNAEGVEWLSGV